MHSERPAELAPGLVVEGNELIKHSVKAATAKYKEAVAADPSYVPALEALAKVLVRKNRWVEVEELCRTAKERGVETPALQFAHSAALQSQFDLDTVDGFLGAVTAAPDNQIVRGRMGRFLATQFKSDEQRILEQENAFLQPLPALVRIETASSCNLRCQHCTTGVAYDSADRRVMSMDTFEVVLQQVRELPTIRTAIMYLGGEPFLNRNHLLMCRRVKDETQVAKVKFVTNATLLTERICREIAISRIDTIWISIDGRSPDENDTIRVRSSYAKIRDNVRMLKRCLDEAGCSTVIQLVNTQIRRADDPSHAVVPDFLREDFPDHTISSGYAMVWPGMTIAQSGLSNVTLATKAPRGFCDHPFFDLAVRANGDITLCCYDISGIEVMGNVHTSTLAETFGSEKYVDLRRAMLRRRGDLVPTVCQRCKVYSGNRFLQDPMPMVTRA